MLFCVECAAFASLRFDDEKPKILVENRVEDPPSRIKENVEEKNYRQVEASLSSPMMNDQVSTFFLPSPMSSRRKRKKNVEFVCSNTELVVELQPNDEAAIY